MNPVQDSFNDSFSTVLERKVRGWLSGVIDDMKRNSPVQQWLDSLPSDSETITEVDKFDKENTDETDDTPNVTDDDVSSSVVQITEPTQQELCAVKTLSVPNKDNCIQKPLTVRNESSTPQSNKKRLERDFSFQSEGSPKLKNPFFRDHSLQSDASGSSGSSVLNVLGSRKIDAESVLLELGFGPSEKKQRLQRIPDRFLVPSKLKGISTDQFIKDEQRSMRMHDCGVFGYRGLTGNPHVPPSTIVAKIMECILQGNMQREEMMKSRHSIADMRSQQLLQAQLASRMRNNSIAK